MKESRNAPVILHCHIPKTAGTTVSIGLRRSFEFFHQQHYHPDPLYILTSEILERLLEINPNLKSLSSHHLRSFPLNISERQTFLITFLRKPEDALISQLRHTQRQFSTFSPEVQRFWPKETPRLSLRELARQFLDRFEADRDFCPQTRFFCSPTAMAKFGLSDGNNYGTDSHEIAQSILNEFHFVGIVDEMKKSLELLTDRLAQRNVRVYFDACGRQNCSPEKAKPTWMTLDDDVGRRVLKASKSDLLLYHHFRDALLASHEKLRKRCWLGFKPATADAIEAFKARGLHEAERSLVNSGRLLWRRQRLGCTRTHGSEWELSSDVLEERVTRAFAEKAQRRMAEKLVQSE
jgi:Sulfotransferase family